jgi:hypothetical protein
VRRYDARPPQLAEHVASDHEGAFTRVPPLMKWPSSFLLETRKQRPADGAWSLNAVDNAVGAIYDFLFKQ